MFIVNQKILGKPKVSFKYVTGSTSCSFMTPSYLNFPSNLIETSSPLIGLNNENIREYVPLIVICAVLIDIICGSPLANLLLAPMRRAAQSQIPPNTALTETTESSVQVSSNIRNVSTTGRMNLDSRERVDSMAVAQAALDRAKNSMELRKYLEENKTDKDRMEDLRKKIDSQLRELSE